MWILRSSIMMALTEYRTRAMTMGYADYVFINVLSTPRNFITGGATGIAGLGVNGPFATRDTGASGRFIHVGSWAYAVSMSREGDYSHTVGSMAHEFGHVFDFQICMTSNTLAPKTTVPASASGPDGLGR